MIASHRFGDSHCISPFGDKNRHHLRGDFFVGAVTGSLHFAASHRKSFINKQARDMTTSPATIPNKFS